MINVEKIEQEIVSSAGELDKTWYRGAPGTPYFHNAPGSHTSSVEIEMGQKIMSLVVEHKPKVLVEIGTNKGFSTTWLMLGMIKNGFGSLITFDIEDMRKVYGMPYWEQYGLPKEMVRYVIGSVWDKKSELPSTIDFMFHDASHDVEPTKKELHTIAPLIPSGGIMSFHDVFLCRHQGEVILDWINERKSDWEYQEWQYGRGLGIARRK